MLNYGQHRMGPALNYSLKRTGGPAVEPVTIAQVKDHLRLAASVDDALVASQIEAARQQVERDTRRSLITQTWRMKLDVWPIDGIQLYNPPVQSVTSVTYTDASGSEQTWDSSLYDVFTDSEPGLLAPKYNQSWPNDRGDNRSIVVTYVTGYGASGSTVPAEYKQAIMLRVEMLYDGENKQLNDAYYRLVNSAKVGVYP